MICTGAPPAYNEKLANVCPCSSTLLVIPMHMKGNDFEEGDHANNGLELFKQWYCWFDSSS
jgi:hypothetical protein